MRNLNGLTDFVQIPMPDGIVVARVRIAEEFDHASGHMKPCIIILREGSNIVDIKVLEINGRVDHLASIKLAALDPNSGLELRLEDLHLFLSDQNVTWLALNYSQYQFSIVTVRDLLNQRENVVVFGGGAGSEQNFNPDLSPSLRLFQVPNDKDTRVERSKMTRVISVEEYRHMGRQEYIIITRESRDVQETNHEINIIDTYSWEVKVTAEI